MAKIDSNVAGLRYALEDSPKTISGNEIWYGLEANSFADYGATYAKVARRPFRDDRQQRKGATAGLDAVANFNVDLVQEGLQDILQGFFYAAFRPKTEVENAAGTEITGVTGATDTIAGPNLNTLFPVGTLVKLSGFGVSQNNVHTTVVTAVSAGEITVAADLADEASPTQSADGVRGARIVEVGFQFTADDLDVTTTGDFATLTTSTKDLTQLGIIPGEFIFVGGDTAGAAGNQFSNAANNGWKRVRSVAANAMVIDKSDAAMITEASAGSRTLRIYYGRVLKNESDSSLISRRTYHIERSLGAPDTGAPSELQGDYVTGATPNTFSMNHATEDKITADLGFVGMGYTTLAAAAAPNLYSAVAAAGSGGAPPIVEEDPYNTASNYSRINLSVVSSSSEAPTPLFVNVETMTLAINNNVNANKALGILGSAGNSIGLFQVTASMSVYFEEVAAIAAIEQNSDCTLDYVLVKGETGAKHGQAWDLPLISLGDGAPELALDTLIKLPLSSEAASGAKIQSGYNHTAMVCFFDALPEAAVVAIAS